MAVIKNDRDKILQNEPIRVSPTVPSTFVLKQLLVNPVAFQIPLVFGGSVESFNTLDFESKVLVNGVDDSANWTLSASSPDILLEKYGASNNKFRGLTYTGPALNTSAFNTMFFYSPLGTQSVDYSKWKRSLPVIENSVQSHATGGPFGGPYTSVGGGIDDENKRVIFTGNAAESSAAPWYMECWLRVPSLPNFDYDHLHVFTTSSRGISIDPYYTTSTHLVLRIAVQTNASVTAAYARIPATWSSGNPWIHVRGGVCTDRFLRIAIDGVIGGSASSGLLSGVSQQAVSSAWDYARSTQFIMGLSMGYAEETNNTIHIAECSMHVSPMNATAFTKPSAAIAIQPQKSTITVTAAKTGETSIVQEVSVFYSQQSAPAVQIELNPPGIITKFSETGAVLNRVLPVVTVRVNGVVDTTNWSWGIDSFLTRSPTFASGLSVLTQYGPNTTAGNVTTGKAYFGKPGYADVEIPITSTGILQVTNPTYLSLNKVININASFDGIASTSPTGVVVLAYENQYGVAQVVTSSYTWSAVVTPTGAITLSSTSSSNFNITGMLTSAETANIAIKGTRTGYPDLVDNITVNKLRAPTPVVVAGGPAAINISGDTIGNVPPSSLPAVLSVSAIHNGSDITNTYTWSATINDSGYTLANTATSSIKHITAVANGSTDNPRVIWTGTRSGGWPTISWATAINKTRVLTPVGFVTSPGPFNVSTSGSSAHSYLKLTTDGRIETKEFGGSWVQVGLWYNPATASIGTGYVAVLSPFSTPVGAVSSNWGSANSLSSDVIYSVGAENPGSFTGGHFLNGFLHVKPSSGNTNLSTMIISLYANVEGG